MEKYQCKNVVASGHTTANLSRMSLLQWINDLLGLKIQKVEALCTGVAYCQIMDFMFRGCISLKKVKFDANQTTEYWNNFKQLQIAFRAVGCEKNVPIDQLIKGRFQENFEFLQWFKRFFDLNTDPLYVKQSNVQLSASKVHTRPGGYILREDPLHEKLSSTQQSTSKVPPLPVATTDKRNKAEREIKAQIEEYQGKAEKVVQEKEFYFNKLRNIEILCTSEDAPNTEKETLVNKILAELYATEEGFEAPEEEEEED